MVTEYISLIVLSDYRDESMRCRFGSFRQIPLYPSKSSSLAELFWGDTIPHLCNVLSGNEQNVLFYLQAIRKQASQELCLVTSSVPQHERPRTPLRGRAPTPARPCPRRPCGVATGGSDGCAGSGAEKGAQQRSRRGG